MNYIFETLIIIGIALFMIMFATLVCFRDEHFYIRFNGVEKKHYVLRKARFLFLPAYAITWNWKTGIIRKSTLLGLFGFYMYFLAFYISDLVYYLVTRNNLVLKQPIVFVAAAVLTPIVAVILFEIIKMRIKYVNGEEVANNDAFSISKQVRDKTDNPINNDDTDEIK